MIRNKVYRNYGECGLCPRELLFEAEDAGSESRTGKMAEIEIPRSF